MHPDNKILMCAGIRHNTVVYHVNDGFYFTKHTQKNRRVFLRCIRRESCNCSASMPLSENNRTEDNFIIHGQHTHEPDFTHTAVAELRKAILLRCREEATDYRTIFDEECARFPKDVSSQFNLHSLTSAMYRERRALKEKILHSFTECDGETPKKNLKRKKSRSLDRKENATSHFKDEVLKEELMVEDYNTLENTNFDEEESSKNSIDETSAIHPSPPKDTSPPIETVSCGADVQVKQEIKDEAEIAHEPDVEFTKSQTTAVIHTETVNQAKDETHCSRLLENIATPDSLNALTLFTNTVDTTNIPPNQINRDNGSLGLSITADGQTVCSSQPVVYAATTPNYLGVLIPNSNTTIPNYIAAPSPVYGASILMSAANIPTYNAATTVDCSTTISTAPNVTPGEPSHDVPLPQTSDCEDLEGIFISLKKVPLERRRKTKDKLLRLVKELLISELNLDPDEISISDTKK